MGLISQLCTTKTTSAIKKRLLIISAWYYPFIHPRAHRWTALAEYWAALGWEVHVLCARRRGCPNESRMNGVWVHRTGFDSLKEFVYFALNREKGRGRVGTGVLRPAWPTRLLGWLYTALWKKIYFPDDAMLWYLPARRKALALQRAHLFDAVISVSLPFTGHLVGRALRRAAPELRWVADIGDPFTIQARPLNNAWLYGRLSRRLERQVLEQADAATVTHSAAASAYRARFGAVAQKLRVIPPLLHPAWKPKPVPSFSIPGAGLPYIHLGYFGAFYAPVRSPDAFLKLLERTLIQFPAWKAKLRIHFFGDVFPEFWDKLAQHPNICLYGLRSREDVRAAIPQMDLLVNIGNITDFQLPSKAVEYLASGKPVLHLSYVEDDPFVAFWGDVSGLSVVQVKNGRVTEPSFRLWLSVLAQIEAGIPVEERDEMVRAYEIEAIAAGYEAVIRNGSHPQSTEGIAAALAHR